MPISIDASGQLFLTSTVDRDVLKSDEFEGKVAISNSQNFASPSFTRVTFRILDLNDNRPQFERAIYQLTLPEDADMGTPAGMVKADDPDAAENGTVVYSIRSTDSVPFNVTASGEIVLSGDVDRETVPNYRFAVLAADLGPERRRGSTEVFIMLEDVNDNSPVFSAEDYMATIPESASRDTLITFTTSTLAASDADIGGNGNIVFSIQGGNSDPFSIDKSTGYISVSEALDAEFQQEYLVRIIARDQGVPSRSAHALVRITVSDINDKDPEFASPSYYFYISEGASPGHVVGNLEASDPDVTQQMIFYSLPDQTNLPFALNQTSGELSLASQLDYENTSLYRFTAVANDFGPPSSRSATVRVTVEVQDIPDTVPMVNNTGTIEISVPENIGVGQAVVEITSSDSNAKYRIDSGNTNGSFTINSTSGVLLTAKELDYEDVSQYTLLVTVYNRHNPMLSASVSVVVNVTDVNDNSPVLTGVPRSLNLSETVAPFSILFIVEATDADSALLTNFYYILRVTTSGSCAQDLFVLFQNGTVAVGGAGISRGRDCLYRLTVAVLDNGNDRQSRLSTAQCDVYVYDVNDNLPIFRANDPLTLSITEGTRYPFEVTTVIANDADLGANGDVTYSIAECEGVSRCQVEDYNANLSQCRSSLLSICPFDIDADTGIVLCLGELDHETVSLYRVLVVATDNGSPPQSTSLTLFVDVQDLNDSPPQISPTLVELTLPEDTPSGSIIFRFNVSDGDNFGDISRLSYSLTSKPPNLSFALTQPADGLTVILRGTIDFERLREVSLAISVSDGAFTDNARIRLVISNTNDNDPAFLQPSYNFSVSESAAMGTVIGMVEAADQDSPDFGPLVYTVLGSGIPFSVNRSTGEISVSSSLDHETTPGYEFNVFVFDSNGGQGARNATVTVTVHVGNEDDNRPIVPAPPSVTVSDPTNTSVINFTATDDDIPGERPSVIFTLERVTVDSRTNATSVFTLDISYTDGVHPQTVFNLTVALEYACEIVQFLLHSTSAELTMSTLCSVTLSVPSTLVLGSNATLMCDASGNAPTVYQWYKDGNRISRPAASGELRLYRVGYEQSGSYSCVAVNEAGRLTAGSLQETMILGTYVCTCSVWGR